MGKPLCDHTVYQVVSLRGLSFSWQEICDNLGFKSRYVAASAYRRFPKNGSYKAGKSTGGKSLMPEWNGNWFVKSETTPRPVLKRPEWCGTPSLQQTGYLQKLSVVFYTSTASEADQLQKLFPCDPKLRSTGFDGASSARLGLSQSGNESCSEMKWGFDCFLMLE